MESGAALSICISPEHRIRVRYCSHSPRRLVSLTPKPTKGIGDRGSPDVEQPIYVYDNTRARSSLMNKLKTYSPKAQAKSPSTKKKSNFASIEDNIRAESL